MYGKHWSECVGAAPILVDTPAVCEGPSLLEHSGGETQRGTAYLCLVRDAPKHKVLCRNVLSLSFVSTFFFIKFSDVAEVTNGVCVSVCSSHT